MKTLVQLRSDVQVEIMTDPNNKIWGTTTLDGYINQAYRKVQKDFNFRWPENEADDSDTSVAGTAEYDPPENLASFDLVRYKGTTLVSTTKKKVYFENDTTISSGTPSEYYLYGGKLGLYPTPDTSGDTIDYLYRKYLATLTATQDSELPDDYAPAIAKYSAYLAWSSPRGNRNTAEEKLADYGREVDTLLTQFGLQDTYDLNYKSQRGTIQRVREDVIT